MRLLKELWNLSEAKPLMKKRMPPSAQKNILKHHPGMAEYHDAEFADKDAPFVVFATTDESGLDDDDKMEYAYVDHYIAKNIARLEDAKLVADAVANAPLYKHAFIAIKPMSKIKGRHKTNMDSQKPVDYHSTKDFNLNKINMKLK